MDRNAVIRWVVIATVLLGGYFLYDKFFGKGGAVAQPIPQEIYKDGPGFVPDPMDPLTADQRTPWQPPEGELCTIKGQRFEAELSTRGAGIRHFRLTDER